MSEHVWEKALSPKEFNEITIRLLMDATQGGTIRVSNEALGLLTRFCGEIRREYRKAMTNLNPLPEGEEDA